MKSFDRGQDRLMRAADGGVLVTEVESGSPAASAGIEPNTIITHVGNTRVRNPAEFYKAVRNLKDTVNIKTDTDRYSVPE
jgi:S1-C subfamily serine protease